MDHHPHAGSSPLTRGKLANPRKVVTRARLIPAHAGKTERGGGRSHRAAAHPRSRGENSAPSTSYKLMSGSSPLTRGKPRADACARGGRGLIPAHAGKTSRGRSRTARSAAHPRSRGENGLDRVRFDVHVGSSPLTRGKPATRPGQDRTLRLIPAHAGKTRSLEPPPFRSGAHPRSRGENPAPG